MKGFASFVETKAKETIASVTARWSPKKEKEPFPPLPPPSRLPIAADRSWDNDAGKKESRKRNNIFALARKASASKTLAIALEKDFSSNTSRQSKKAIQNTIIKIFKETKGPSAFPPSPERIKTLASILKAAKVSGFHRFPLIFQGI